MTRHKENFLLFLGVIIEKRQKLSLVERIQFRLSISAKKISIIERIAILVTMPPDNQYLEMYTL